MLKLLIFICRQPTISHACNEIIDDIEDLVSAQDITPKERYSSRKNIKIKVKRKVLVMIKFIIRLFNEAILGN